MKYSILLLSLLATPIYAGTLSPEIGIGADFNKLGPDNQWYDAPYPHVQSQRTYSINIGIADKLYTNFRMSTGILYMQPHYLASSVPYDIGIQGGYCTPNCTPLGDIQVRTNLAGVYLLASPQYGPVFLNLGGWYFRENVNATLNKVPGLLADGIMTYYSFNLNQTVYGVAPILGFGIEAGKLRFDLNRIYINTRQPVPGLASPITRLSVSYSF